MAGASEASGSRFSLLNTVSDEEDSLMAAIDAFEFPVTDNLEKSLTNLNVNIASVAQQLEELTRSYQEFSANFNKQQQLLYEEISLLRVEACEIRKSIRNGL
ncbi:hypothetical protein POM88_015442 [Heracleum sosnowskyi]|uniref:Uncharacterized protein n=1 Tax=Heracleum sosnowskyi TaxID=360622 RepID=A0AAD8IJX5_9APIA|nr:hypothetical protein POM88_015442 [Heracleum sosnowskyi]